MLAVFLGQILYFWDNSFAIGPAVIIATVLFAVNKLIKPVRKQIPNSQVFLFLIILPALLIIKVIPPLYLTILNNPPASIATIIVVAILTVPSPMQANAPKILKIP